MFVMAATLCSVGNATFLRAADEPKLTNKDGQEVMQPTYEDLDNVPNPPTESVETFKPKYAEFFDGEEEEKEKDEGKTFKPTYKEPSPMESVGDVSVTKEFCAQVLQDMKDKRAPYYVQGEYTGEMRADLVSQCGASICNWSAEYRDSVEDCGACPSECGETFDPAEFFRNLLGKENGDGDKVLSAILKISHSKSENGRKTITLTVASDDDEEEDVSAATGAEDDDGYPLPAKKGVDAEPSVTKAFCLDVMRKIRQGEAPYVVEGVVTEEARADLKKQCAELVCGWSVAYAKLLTERHACASESSGEYLDSLLKNSNGMKEIEMYATADDN